MTAVMTYNGVASTEFGITIINIARPILAGSNHVLTRVPGRHGSYVMPGELKDREITVECVVNAASYSLLRTIDLSIAKWLYQTAHKILSFSDQPGKYYMAVLTEPINEDQLLSIGQFTLTFIAEPFIYEIEASQAFVLDAATVSNAGAVVTPPRFAVTFTATASEWKVINGSGEYIRIVHGFVATDTLEINCLTGAILHNGVRAMILLDWQNSTFFELVPGNNTLGITPTGKCTATVKHTPRWL